MDSLSPFAHGFNDRFLYHKSLAVHSFCLIRPGNRVTLLVKVPCFWVVDSLTPEHSVVHLGRGSLFLTSCFNHFGHCSLHIATVFLVALSHAFCFCLGSEFTWL